MMGHFSNLIEITFLWHVLPWQRYIEKKTSTIKKIPTISLIGIATFPKGKFRGIVTLSLMYTSTHSAYPLLRCCLVTKSCPTLSTPWTIAHQALLSMTFFRQKFRVGCHFLFQGIFPAQGSSPSLLDGRHITYHWVTWESQPLLPK